MDTISDKHIEKALDFLRDSSGEYARARAEVKYLEQYRKTMKATTFLECRGDTIAERESKAYAAPAYVELLDRYHEAVYKAEELAAKRLAAELKIEVWRTVNANKRAGNI